MVVIYYQALASIVVMRKTHLKFVLIFGHFYAILDSFLDNKKA